MNNKKQISPGFDTMILILLILLSSCEIIDPRLKIENYRCSQDQTIILEQEIFICQSTGYIYSSCYYEAMISFCEYTCDDK